jgi:signal transduction histidine kinase
MLEAEIVERKRVQAEAEQAHHELLSISRQAGMAEVATGVLHNVGNVLNSVNVGAHVLAEKLRTSRLGNLSKAIDLIRVHEMDLAAFLTKDPKGQQLPQYLSKLVQHLAAQHDGALKELGELSQNVDHIKQIVTMQQSYARISGVIEQVRPADLVEDALRLNAAGLARDGIELVKDYDPRVPDLRIDKHKVLQILVNLVRNAKHACEEGRNHQKRLNIRVANGEGRVKISINDNGIGIPPENLTRIFTHGFTTRKDGHGFGLHSGALAAKELGGALSAHSEGSGLGATFTLELPVCRTD